MTLELLRVGVTSLVIALILGLALLAIYVWKAKAAVAAIVLGAGLLGMLLVRFA